MDMSGAAAPRGDEPQFEQILSQLEQCYPTKAEVSATLNAANAAFVAQFSCPNGHMHMQACDELLRFLNAKVPALDYSEQKLLVQVVQVACAMHENAVNNSTLTPEQQLSHYLATTSLVPLCKAIIEKDITFGDLWFEASHLCARAGAAHAKATAELDISKYFDFDNLFGDDTSFDFEASTSATTGDVVASPAPVPAGPVTVTPPKAATVAPSKVVTRKLSVQDITNISPKLGKTKDLDNLRVYALLKDLPQTGETAPLGRRHTMPELSRTYAPYPSRTSKARASMERSGDRALLAVEEGEE